MQQQREPLKSELRFANQQTTEESDKTEKFSCGGNFRRETREQTRLGETRKQKDMKHTTKKTPFPALE